MSALLLILKALMWVCIAMAGVCLCVIVKIKLFPSDKQSVSEVKKLRKKPIIKMLNCDGDAYEDEWHTYIAGLPHCASKYDVGGFTGWVENDFDNAYDSKAMGIYNSFGKMLGYIPAKELLDYRDWCRGESMPCMGFVYVENGQYRGRVKILRPCNETFLQTEFSRYAQWIYDNHGKEYLPESMSMNFDIE